MGCRFPTGMIQGCSSPTIMEHDSVLQAFAAGDAQGAEEMVRAHVENMLARRLQASLFDQQKNKLFGNGQWITIPYCSTDRRSLRPPLLIRPRKSFTPKACTRRGKGWPNYWMRIHLPNWTCLATHHYTDFGMDQRKIPADGVITGFGEINGRKVCVYAQDFAALSGTYGEMHGKKICALMDLAAEVQVPIIGICHSGGLRLHETLGPEKMFGRLFRRNTLYSGVVPQISIILGVVAGGQAYSPGLTDFILTTKIQLYLYCRPCVCAGPDRPDHQRSGFGRRPDARAGQWTGGRHRRKRGRRLGPGPAVWWISCPRVGRGRRRFLPAMMIPAGPSPPWTR